MSDAKPSADRIRAAIQAHPERMTSGLARDLGVPEAEILRHFPNDRAVELDLSRWEELIRSLEGLGTVHVIVSSGSVTLEAVGRFGNFSRTGEFLNVQTSDLDLHIRWRELGSVFAVQKPAHFNQVPTYSVQFYDGQGKAAFKVFLNFGDPATPERIEQFQRLRERFARPAG
jgi:putative heme iron utilization protein